MNLTNSPPPEEINPYSGTDEKQEAAATLNNSASEAKSRQIAPIASQSQLSVMTVSAA